jgi:hypothetical protein
MATIPTYTVSGSGDVYRCFAIPSGLATTSYITELEVIPGNSSIVHHVLVFQDTTQTPVNLDNSDPNAGYNAFGGTGSNASKLIGAWVPGSKPTKYPQGMGVRLPANANLVIQVHYPSGSAGESDSTQIRFKLATGNIRQMYISPVLNHTTSLTNGPLFIPANTVKTFNAQYTVPANVSVYSVAPHMHLIGKSVKSYGITPGTLDTIPLIKIDNWDFHWQGAYAFKKFQKIGIGTKLKAEIVYDNTLNNPYNPSNPPIDVAQGEGTTDEMMLIYFSYLIYQPGDENIVIDATPNLGITPKNELSFSTYPNPAKDFLQVSFPENVSENLHFSIWDTNGRLLKEGEWDATYQKHFSLPVNEFATGNYWLKVSGKEIEGYKQWIIGN